MMTNISKTTTAHDMEFSFMNPEFCREPDAKMGNAEFYYINGSTYIIADGKIVFVKTK